MCSFNDAQVSEYVQAKKRLHGHLPTKKAVSKVGRQANGLWVLNSQLTLNEKGEVVSEDENPYIWIGSIYQGFRIAKGQDAIALNISLDSKKIVPLLLHLKKVLQHNFFAGLLLIGACAMALHYETILSKFLSCPVPIAFGPSGTGKTTALRCGLSLIGAYPDRFFSHGTKEKYLELCSTMSFPIGIDDPSFQKDVDKLVVDLFNGAKSGNISRGERLPITTAIIAANFTTSAAQRYNNYTQWKATW